MAFTTNQTRQIYVAKDYKATASAFTTKGDITVGGDANCFYFIQKGADGNVRSDLINKATITHAKATKADAMKRGLTKYKVSLSSSVNSGAPVAGQTYSIKINIKNFVSLAEESTYFKQGTAYANSTTTASELYCLLAISLAKNFSRELTKFFKFYVTDGTDETEVFANTTVTTLDPTTNTYTGVIIEEAEQEWTRGIKQQEAVNFELIPDAIIVSGNEEFWGDITKETPTSFVTNGKKIADMEYFYMGERGDIYRNINWPNSIVTEYLVDPTKEYHTIDIHYAFVDEGVSSYRSEKDVTIFVEKGAAGSEYTTINAVIGAINTLTGLSIATLS